MNLYRFTVMSILLLLAGCSSVLTPLIYAGLKNKLPDTEVEYIASEEQLVWHRNTSQAQQLNVKAHDWHELHQGSSAGWQWQFVALVPKNISAQELSEWDDLFERFAKINAKLLPNLGKVKVTLYLLSGSKQQVTVDSTINSDVLELPSFYWGEDEKVLPQKFSERIDLLAELGTELQMAQFASSVLPQPSNREAAQLKMHANSACWRLAVRPALALNTEQVVKAPPSAFSDMAESAKKVYQKHRSEIPAQSFYATVLLVNEADRYMAAADLNWPLRGSDEREISALVDFCKSYLMIAKDPRT